MKKLKVCIGLDDWKLPIFERHLKQGGYDYKTCAGVTSDTLLMTVYTYDLDALEVVALAANTEAAGIGTRQ